MVRVPYEAEPEGPNVRHEQVGGPSASRKGPMRSQREENTRIKSPKGPDTVNSAEPRVQCNPSRREP